MENISIEALVWVSFLLGMFGYFVISVALKLIIWMVGDIYKNVKRNRLFKDKEKQRSEMLEHGDHHEWVEFLTLQGEVMVCKKTGWCPEHRGYYPLEMVDRQIRVKEENDKLKQRFNEFKHDKIKEISKKTGIQESNILEIEKRLIKIREDWYELHKD